MSMEAVPVDGFAMAFFTVLKALPSNSSLCEVRVASGVEAKLRSGQNKKRDAFVKFWTMFESGQEIKRVKDRKEQ